MIQARSTVGGNIMSWKKSVLLLLAALAIFASLLLSQEKPDDEDKTLRLAIGDAKLKVIQGLFAQDPNIAIGLEMLPAETQPALDKWSQGLLSEDDLIRELRWYVNWSMNFGYYEKIFYFARDNRIPIFGLNAPRDVI